MTYGKWKALHPTSDVNAAPVAPENACEICGKEIPTRTGGSGNQKKYTCSAACDYERHLMKARMHYHKKKVVLAPEKVDLVCEICGKVIPKGRRSPYTCSEECREQRHRERVQMNTQKKKARLMADGKI